MRYLLFLLFFVSFLANAQEDTFFILNAAGATGPQVSNVNVKYNATDYSYITSKAGYSDTAGPFQTGANVIDVSGSTPTNSGLSYDPLTDRFIMYGGTRYFFTREAFTIAAATPGDLIPSDETITFSNSPTGQGISIDPVNREWYVQGGETEFYRYNYAGTLQETVTFSSFGVGTPLSFNSFDYGSKTLYCTSDGAAVYGFKKINGTWAYTFQSTYLTNEGSVIDYTVGGSNGKMVYNGSTTNQSIAGTIKEQYPFYGKDIVEHPYPLSSMSTVVEGMTVDQADGSFWVNSDQLTHGGITNGNRLWHTDPRGWYKKFYRSPHMHRFSEVWKTNGNVITGIFGTEAIKGTNFSTGPVIDYGAFTGQQTLGNWTFGEGENATIEFRGSSTAPTTTPEAAREYYDVVVYDANGSNDGWGSTTPGAWQSTPTTDRYMQVRIKPLAPIISTAWTPENLGDTLIAWYSGEKTTKYGLANQYQSANVRWWGSGGNEASRMYNKKDPNDDWMVNSSSAWPIWNTAVHVWDLFAVSTNWVGNYTYLTSNIIPSNFEFTCACQRTSTGVRAIFMGIANSGSNNNRYIFNWTASTGTPGNYLSIEITDNAGAVTRHGVTKTGDQNTQRMLSFRVGANPNKIYFNKVLQTLTDNSGTNTGQGPDVVWSLANSLRFGRVGSSTAIQGGQRMGDVFITKHLSDWARAKLYDWYVSIGQLP